ncbi:hypothetical protein K505DRAFT_254043 [Melanomma pulvis-pyrius CBS 109.77]|uniref:Uncharacterized protein n=1 Tax=Melanomma pulvis-pyrius CBS 109.77 TaxID=1314802 RepID=A0A6A6WYY9_9PLEO|nr:hypothetical protein K505DRAFT_254043 [Melanomma pulvis-pyrius CBS 109.77]
MPGIQPDPYALLESSFQASPNLRSHKTLPRRRDELRSIIPASEPLKQDTSRSDDETDSQVSSERRTLLASPASLKGAESGLPPTPPSNSQDDRPSSTFSLPPYADGVVTSLLSKNSSLSTPVNQRSPPTPDPSPPRTTESMTLPDRPVLFAYPSSRAESFKTAREHQFSSEGGDSRSNTPLADKLMNAPSTDRLSTVKEDRGLGLAFEREDDDATPTNRVLHTFSAVADENKPDENKDPLNVEDIPNREWDTNLMRNVSIRKKRKTKPSPQKHLDSVDTASPATGSTPRRTSSLRERVEASKNSPITPSFENFAQSIGWPAEATMPGEQLRDADHKRLSTSSMTSTVVEAMVIVTPPRQRRALRHSGKNLAYRADTDSPTDFSSTTSSNRNSVNADDVPLHRLVHKRASINGRKLRANVGSDTMGMDRYASPLSIRKRGEENAAFTLAHQESVRRVLQPAADIMSRTSSFSRPYASEKSYHKRIASAPEATRRRDFTPEPRSFLELSPPASPTETADSSTTLPRIEQTSPFTPSLNPYEPSSLSPKLRVRSRASSGSRNLLNINKSLPQLPAQSTVESSPQEDHPVQEHPTTTENLPLTTQLDTASMQSREQEVAQPSNMDTLVSSRQRESSEIVTPIRRGSISVRGRSEERRRSSTSQDRTSTSRDTLLRPTLDRVPTEELPRHSYEWHALHADGTRRVSFDSSTIRTEEHAMARHLYAQTTPFSQISDTPIEVSEATAVSIYPHNNHSLLVVQQLSRSSTQPLEQRQVVDELHYTTSDLPPPEVPSTPPFVDASEEQYDHVQGPTLTFEPSTPPMQLLLPVSGVDSPLKNPRKPPEPPIIQFIPPTPAEELERQLMPSPPGPPKHSDSHPQRRLSLVQRARRYSGNIISPFLARASSSRGRFVSDRNSTHENPRIPTVNDEDGSLHPFWRPRGFWDGFEDSGSDSDDALPQGGDTSDVEDMEREPAPKKLGVLGRRLTNGFKGSGGFLIGNSLGVERAGTNKRRPHILPPPRRISTEPKILVQPPTLPLSFRSRSPRVEKRASRSSLQSAGSGVYERSRRGSRRDAWKTGKTIPGLNMQVQYIGLSGVKERLREKKAEKRRETLRKSIGSRYYVEGGVNVG